MDDVTVFFVLLLALVGAFAVLAVSAAVRARRDDVRRWWTVPAVSVAVAAAPILVGVAGLLVLPSLA